MIEGFQARYWFGLYHVAIDARAHDHSGEKTLHGRKRIEIRELVGFPAHHAEQ